MHMFSSPLARRLAVLSLLIAAPVSGIGCIASIDEDGDEMSEEVDGETGEPGADEAEVVETREDAVSGPTVLQATASS